jgi:hypothetical protein
MGDDEDHTVVLAVSRLAVDVTLPGRIAFGHRIDDHLVVARGFLVVTLARLGVRPMYGMHIPLALQARDLPASEGHRTVTFPRLGAFSSIWPSGASAYSMACSSVIARLTRVALLSAILTRPHPPGHPADFAPEPWCASERYRQLVELDPIGNQRHQRGDVADFGGWVAACGAVTWNVLMILRITGRSRSTLVRSLSIVQVMTYIWGPRAIYTCT